MPSLRNAEVKLEGARFFLELIEQRQEEPRSVYHLFGAFLNALYTMRESLKKETNLTTPSFNSWYAEQLRNHDKYKEFNAWLQRRGTDIHDRPLPLYIAVPIKVSANFSSCAIAIKVRAQGTSDVLAEIVVGESLTGLFEDMSNRPQEVSSILEAGHLTMEMSPKSPHDANILMVPRYEYTSKNRSPQDVMRTCRSLFKVAEELLQEYRQIHGL